MPEPRFSLSQIDREMLLSDLDWFDSNCHYEDFEEDDDEYVQ